MKAERWDALWATIDRLARSMDGRAAKAWLMRDLRSLLESERPPERAETPEPPRGWWESRA